MRRRSLFAVPMLLAATSARAADTASAAGAVLPMRPVGLPVIEGGRVRNYVFVRVRLQLAPGQNPEPVRIKEAFFRDALVRAAHRTPFTLADTWLALDGPAILAAVMRAAPDLVGRGVVARAEIMTQTPRRRTGLRGA